MALQIKQFSYRYAEAVLQHSDFERAFNEVKTIIKDTPVYLLDPENLNSKKGGVKRRGRSGRYFFLPVDQKKINKSLDEQFIRTEGWSRQPLIIDQEDRLGADTKLKGDFKKGRLHVEVQFGNMARWYTDVFKFQLSYALDKIDVAILVVPMKELANLIDENVAHYERIVRELPFAKMSLTLPIMVLGVSASADDRIRIRKCYDIAAATLAAHKTIEEGSQIRVIDYDDRIKEEDVDEIC